MYPERQQGGGGGGAPHGILLAVVVAIVVIVPFLLGDQGEAITEAISELLSPLGLLLLPIILLLTIQFLSSERGSFISAIFSTGEPDTIHRVSGSPFGVALFLVLVLVLLFNRFSIFGGDDSDDWKQLYFLHSRSDFKLYLFFLFYFRKRAICICISVHFVQGWNLINIILVLHYITFVLSFFLSFKNWSWHQREIESVNVNLEESVKHTPPYKPGVKMKKYQRI